MSVPSTSQPAITQWRVIVSGIVTALLALIFLLVLFGVPLLLSPWIVVDSSTPTYHGDLHRWLDAVNAAFTAVLMGGSLVGLVWQGQKRPLLAQNFLVGFLIFSLGQIVFRPEPASFILPLVILGLFVLAYPRPRALLRLTPEGGWSLPLLIFTILTALVIAPNVWHNLSLQITDKTSEQALNWQWVIAATTDIALVVAGFLTATKRPGWRVLGLLVGFSFVYLAVAALLLPSQAGSWGGIGGLLSGLGGLGYLGTMIYEMQRNPLTRHPTMDTEPVKAH